MGIFNLGKNQGSKGATLPASLQDDSQKFRIIIDSIEDGVIMIDHEQTIRLINPGAAAICGWSTEEAMGIDVNQVIKLVNDKGEPLEDTINPLKQIFNSDKPVRADNAFLMTKYKQQLPITLNVSPLLDKSNRVTAAVAVLSNVSKERAEEKQRADFISTASHEMRTPVAAIEGYLALSLNEKVATVDERAKGYLQKAHDSTEHLGKLFQDLLTSAKADDGRLTSHPVVVELGEFLQQLVDDLRLVAEKKGLSMEYASGEGNIMDATKDQGGQKVVRPLFYVLVDPDRLREVITNLFDNAVKYTPEGKVSIGITGNNDVIQCYVRDTGPGIPANDLPHLFQKFYRVDNSATRTIGGTGLGLFICRKIVELYGGRIWAESEVGKGSSFYINLPRLSSQKAAELQAASQSQNVVKPEATA